MSIKRYGTGQTGAGGKPLPVCPRRGGQRGWLHVSGQVAMEDGEIIDGNIVAQTHKAIANLIAILHEADYGVEHVVRVGVWLDDPRDFWTLQQNLRGLFRRPSAGARLRAVVDDGGLQGGD